MNVNMRGLRGRKEDTDMHVADYVESKKLNWGNLIQIVLIIFVAGGLYQKISTMDERFASKTVVEENVKEIAQQAAFIQLMQEQNLIYRLGQNETAIRTGDERTTRLVDSFVKRNDATNEKVDNLIDTVNEFRTDTKVMGSKVEGLSDQIEDLATTAKKMNFKPVQGPDEAALSAERAHPAAQVR